MFVFPWCSEPGEWGEDGAIRFLCNDPAVGADGAAVMSVKMTVGRPVLQLDPPRLDLVLPRHTSQVSVPYMIAARMLHARESQTTARVSLRFAADSRRRRWCCGTSATSPAP